MGNFLPAGIRSVAKSGFFGPAPVAAAPPTSTWTIQPAFPLTVVSDLGGTSARIVALDGNGAVAYSDDKGVTWHSGSGFTGVNAGFAFAPNTTGSLWVAVCQNGVTFTSADGATWTQSGTIAPIFGNPRVAFGNGLFMVVTNSSAQNVDVFTSPDGITWTNGPTTTPDRFASLLFDGSDFVGGAHSAGGTAQIVFATNRTPWTATTAPAYGTRDISRLAFAGGVYVASDVQFPSVVQQSPSRVWAGTNVVQPLDDNVAGIAFGVGVWCLVGQAVASAFPQAATSPDLTTWTLEDMDLGAAEFENVQGVAFAGGTLIGWTFDGKVTTRN